MKNNILKNRRILLAIIGIILLICIFCACSKQQRIDDSKFTILYTNDVHCSYDNYPILAAYKEKLQSDGDNIIVVDGGDFVQGNIAGASDDGETIIKLMNKVGYDYVVPGNHEYDYGMDAFIDNAKLSDFKWITCNYNETGKYRNAFSYDAYKIIKSGKHKIAILGIEYEENLEECIDKVNKAINDAKNDGADYIVAVGHTGSDTKNIIEKTTGIDIYLNAHDHVVNDADTKRLSYQDSEGKTVFVYETGNDFQYVGQLDIDCESEEIQYSFELKFMDDLKSEITKNMSKSTKKIMDSCKNILVEYDKILESYKVEIGKSECTLCVYDPIRFPQYVDYIEYNSTDLIADAFKEAGKTDIALLNQDSVRVGILPGPVTLLDIISLFPWNEKVYTTNLSGQEIIEILEYTLRNYPKYTSISPVVSGMTFTIDSSVPWTPNSNNRVKSVMINDKPLELDKMYSVTSSEYYLLSGIKDIINKTDSDCDYIGKDYDLIEQYITNNLKGVIPESIYGNPEGLHRIACVNGNNIK